MKKQLLLIILFGTFFCFRASAQDQGGGWDKRTNVYGVETRTNAFEVGAEYLLPGGGDFGNVYKNGFGGALRYRFGVAQYKSLLVSAGYNTFKGEVALPGNNAPVNVRANFIPIKVGMKFGLSDYVYLAGEVGTTIGLGVKGIDDVNLFVRDSYQIKGALFNFAPSFGILIPSKNKNYLDLSIRYEGMSVNRDFNFFTGIRAAYGFNIAR
ncbi:hypothetical protein D0C36_12735 [Mucilaginibacter conchicola]|uniref:Outer membrane protein beta-barrel domain-containing protein n=1 Tax=Mucilaginibacter conchicola TaxID=2303333 RepID=A0A372NUL0_9SPHI|nr:hypothetical protein [Mucilaginibacter conchicola]RFZ92297.1 hypothetical protein D0C36_12735 [Mucilaginibacter conchicola]